MNSIIKIKDTAVALNQNYVNVLPVPIARFLRLCICPVPAKKVKSDCKLHYNLHIVGLVYF